MFEFIIIAVVAVVAFAAGMLVGRHNPKLSAELQAIADNAKARGIDLTKKL